MNKRELCATCNKELNPRYSEKPPSKYLKLLATPVRFCSKVCTAAWMCKNSEKQSTVEKIHKELEEILTEGSN